MTKRLRRAVAAGFLCGLMLAPVGAGAVAAGRPRVDLNAATAAELERLPGVGPAKAQAILEHRAKVPFVKPEDLRKVKGIGERLYEQLRDEITVGEKAASASRGG